MEYRQRGAAMPSERKPVECWHPSVFIREEMEARGWNRLELAIRMCPELQKKLLEIDLYFEVGPTQPGMRLGDGEDFARAFGVDAEFFRNLEAAWLKSQGIPPAGRGDA